ncbi:MAG TPA: ABC transporter permease [Actinomycetota bacterium]|nr:ABC transporter permease [Actinomycetota bacterium]
MAKLTFASIRMLYRDKQALFWAMAFPVIFTVVFGLFDFTDSPEARFGVVAERPTPVSEALRKGLREIDSFTVERRGDLAAARADVEDGELDVVLVVPSEAGAPAPGRSAAVTAYYNEGNVDVNQFALDAVTRIVDGLNLQLAGVTAPAIDLRQRGLDGRTVEYYDFLLPGLVAMGVMNFSIIGMSVAIARFREQRILKRILATPLRPVKFLSAQVLARLLLSLVQAALILAVGVVLFGAQIYGNVVWLFVLATLANLVFLNIGFAVAGRASNADAAQGIGNAVAIPMMFLSGVFFPTDTLPGAVQAVVKYLPLTPLIEAMRKVSIEGLSIADTGPQLLLLGAWVAISFAIAGRAFRFAKV